MVEVTVQETTQRSHDDVSLQTFGQKKSVSIDFLHENQHYKSAERGFDDGKLYNVNEVVTIIIIDLDDNNIISAYISLCSCIATGQLSTPFRVNPTPEHLLKGEIINQICWH